MEHHVCLYIYYIITFFDSLLDFNFNKVQSGKFCSYFGFFSEKSDISSKKKKNKLFENERFCKSKVILPMDGFFFIITKISMFRFRNVQ